jgi:hypothetical protein
MRPPRRVELVRCQERQAEAGVHELARWDPDSCQVFDVYPEAGAKVRLDGGPQGHPSRRLTIDSQDPPAGTEQLARVASGAAGQVHGEVAPQVSAQAQPARAPPRPRLGTCRWPDVPSATPVARP